MLRWLALGAGVGSILASSLLGCSDTTVSRRTPVPIGGHAGQDGDCEVCAAAGGATGGASEAGLAGAGGEPSGPDLSLTAISITQSVEVRLMTSGAAVAVTQRAAPIVAAKRALVRAFIELAPGYERRPLLGVLDLKAGERSQSFVSELSPSKSSLQDDLTTTFTFDVAARELGVTSEYRLRVLEADATPLHRFPEEGYEPLGARALEPFELVLVPMVLNGHAPRAGQEEVEQIERRLLSLYPAASVTLSVAAPFVSERTVDGEGGGWDESLEDLLQHRADVGAPPRAFYYGLMAPGATYADYCARSCLLGLSNVPKADLQYERGSIGIAVFEDGSGRKAAWDTLAHELGHALGRDHADCGEPDFPDPYNPYEDGGLGATYGYDFSTARLVKPRQYRDVMSYCEPVWVSDYTYSGLFERLLAIDSQALRVRSLASPTAFRVARIDRFGQSSWRRERTTRGAEGLTPFPLLDAKGRAVGAAQGRVVRLDHLPGGSVWLRAGDLSVSRAHSVDLRAAGGSVLAL